MKKWIFVQKQDIFISAAPVILALPFSAYGENKRTAPPASAPLMDNRINSQMKYLIQLQIIGRKRALLSVTHKLTSSHNFLYPDFQSFNLQSSVFLCSVLTAKIRQLAAFYPLIRLCPLHTSSQITGKIPCSLLFPAGGRN
mgnify:CR=1 FL=1